MIPFVYIDTEKNDSMILIGFIVTVKVWIVQLFLLHLYRFSLVLLPCLMMMETQLDRKPLP